MWTDNDEWIEDGDYDNTLGWGFTAIVSGAKALYDKRKARKAEDKARRRARQDEANYQAKIVADKKRKADAIKKAAAIKKKNRLRFITAVINLWTRGMNGQQASEWIKDFRASGALRKRMTLTQKQQLNAFMVPYTPKLKAGTMSIAQRIRAQKQINQAAQNILQGKAPITGTSASASASGVTSLLVPVAVVGATLLL